MTAIEDARDRYLRWGAEERAHAAYCIRAGRTDWRCWNYLGRAVEAASVAADMAEAERISGRHPRIASKEYPLG